MQTLLTWWIKEKSTSKVSIYTRIFFLFVLYVDDMIGKETLVIFVNLSQIMEAKMEGPIFHMRGLVNGWIETAIAILHSRIILGALIPSTLQYREKIWKYGLVLGLAQ